MLKVTPMGDPLRLLIVEDIPNDAELMVMRLQRDGYEVEWQRVDAEGDFVAHLDANLDLILSDYVVPGFGGEQALELLKQSGLEIPFIVVSGTLGEEKAVALIKSGVTDYILKDKMARLGEAVRRARAEKQLRLDKEQAEQARRESDARFRRLAENAPDIIYRWGVAPELGLEYVSPAVTVITGYAPEEFYARPALLLEIAHPDDRPIVLQMIGGQKPFEPVAFRIIRKDGTMAWLERRSTPVRDEAGNLIATDGIIRDISDRVQAQEALHQSETRFRQMAENAHDLIFRYRLLPTRGFEYVSPSATRILGYTPEEHYADPELGFKLVHPDDLEQLEKMLIAPSTITQPVVLRWIHKNGSIVWLEQRNVPAFDLAGNVVAIEGIARDITERKRAEDALHEAESKYRSIFENALMGIYQTSPEGRYITANTALAHMFGYDTAEELMAAVTDLNRQFYVSPTRRDEFKRLIDTATGTTGFESEAYRNDGSTMWISETGRAVRDAEGTLLYYEGVTEDITARRQAEQALQRRAVQLALVNEISKQIAAVLDLERVFEAAVSLIHERFGYQHVAVYTLDRAHNELPMRARAGLYASRFPTDHRLKAGVGMVGWVAQQGEMLLANDVSREPRFFSPFADQIIQSEVSVPIKIGAEIAGVLDVQSGERDAFQESDLQVLETLAGQIAVAIANASLYHELETYSEYLEEAVRVRTAEIEYVKDRLQSILDNCPDPIILLDREGAVEAANPAFFQTFRANNDAIFGNSLSDVMYTARADAVREALREVIEKGETRRLEVTALRRDGTTFAADMALAPIQRGDQGAGAVCILRDITTIKEVQRLKDEFVSNVSHELRTPITGIKLNHDLIVRDPTRQDVYLVRQKREIDRLNALIEDLLRLSRLDQGRVEMHLEPTDLNVLVAQYADDRAPLAESRQLRLTGRLASGICTVMADKGLLGQVLSILLTNAINYTRPGGRIVIQSRTRKNRTGQWAGFSVKDTGLGISPDEQAHLFQRFFRGKVGQSSGAAGTGLGLAIAKEIVDRHGGRIEIASEGVPGKGTTFSVWLPAAKSSQG